jgi:hypothetical protein
MPNQLPAQEVPGVKRPGPCADHSPPSSAEVTNGLELYPSLPLVPWQAYHGVTFIIYNILFTVNVSDSVNIRYAKSPNRQGAVIIVHFRLRGVDLIGLQNTHADRFITYHIEGYTTCAIKTVVTYLGSASVQASVPTYTKPSPTSSNRR